MGDQVVHRDRRGAEGDEQPGFVVGRGRWHVGREGRGPVVVKERGARGIGGAEHRDDVGGGSDQVRPLLDERIAAFGAGIEWRAGDGEDVPILLQRQARRDQRAAALGGFNDDNPQRQTRHQPVTTGKIAGARLPAQRHFGEQGAAGIENRMGQRDVL